MGQGGEGQAAQLVQVTCAWFTWGGDINDDMTGGHMQMDVLCDLCYLSMMPHLSLFVNAIRWVDSLAPAVAHYLEQDNCGFALFFNCIVMDLVCVPPDPWITTTHYLLTDLLKRHVLVKILHKASLSQE